MHLCGNDRINNNKSTIDKCKTPFKKEKNNTNNKNENYGKNDRNIKKNENY
jgi:hypothetical protein